MRVLVAGATGAVGRQLVPQLIAAGHQVSATTRSPAKTAGLRAAGADPHVLDGLDGAAVAEVVAQARPDVIVHEMTAIPAALSFRTFDRAFAVTSQLRTAGTDHLLAAARAAGVQRFIAQSFTGFTNLRAGGPVKNEEDPFDPRPPTGMGRAYEALRYLERAVTSAPLTGIALRYGGLYGPGASEEIVAMVRRRRVPVIGSATGVWSFLHVTDAAAATVAALSAGAAGVYNVTDDEPATVAQWLPVLASCVGAPPPRRVPAWLGRILAGEAAVTVMTQARGSSNAKARRELRWTPAWPTWRQGFAGGLDRAWPGGRGAAVTR